MVAVAPANFSLEAEKELQHFLRLARPEWSSRAKSGKSKVASVIEKLKSVGICDTETLVDCIEKNTLSDRLVAGGHVSFGKDAVDAIRRQMPFIRTLDSMDTPYVRQVGKFASVPQMLSQKRICGEESGGGVSSPMARSASDIADGGAGRMIQSAGTTGLGGLGKLPRSLTFSGRLGPGEIAFDAGGELRLRGTSAMGPRQKRPPRGTLGSGSTPDTPQGGSTLDLRAALMGQETRSNTAGSLSGSQRMLPGLTNWDGKVADSTMSSWGARDVKDGSGAKWPSGGTLPPVNHAGAASAGGHLSSSSSGAIAGNAGENWKSKPNFAQQASGGTGLGATASSASTASALATTGKGAKPAMPGMTAVNSNKGQHEPVPVSHDEVRDMMRMGSTMRGDNLEARWAPAYKKSLGQQGEDMLKEQESHDERQHFIRMINSAELRPHIARNIRARLKEEALRDSTQGLNIQQHCMNIRKQIACMTNARRELAGMTRMMASMNPSEDDADNPKDKFAEMAGGFGGKKKDDTEDTEETDGEKRKSVMSGLRISDKKSAKFTGSG